jgi:hypothetical protein
MPRTRPHQLVHRHDRQHHREHEHQDDAPHHHDQRRLDERRQPRQAPFRLALEFGGGADEHRRERAALLAVGDQMNENGGKRLLFLQCPRQRHTLAHETRRPARCARERNHAYDVRRSVQRAQ